jgi:hypothetical protein
MKGIAPPFLTLALDAGCQLHARIALLQGKQKYKNDHKNAHDSGNLEAVRLVSYAITALLPANVHHIFFKVLQNTCGHIQPNIAIENIRY